MLVQAANCDAFCDANRTLLMPIFLTGVLSHPLLSLHQSWIMDVVSSTTLTSYQSICSTSLIFLPNTSCCHRYMYICICCCDLYSELLWCIVCIKLHLKCDIELSTPQVVEDVTPILYSSPEPKVRWEGHKAG